MKGFLAVKKKRSEVLQMTVLKPRISILDEPDSGLDIDSVQAVAKAISNTFDKNTTTIMITHYARILNYLDKLDYVHVFAQGKNPEDWWTRLSQANLRKKVMTGY